jgi:ketosteroid isomerase-like protein
MKRVSADQVRAYCAAFERKERDAIVALFAPGGLFEFPLLGQRLVGHAEIGTGLDRVFAILDSCAIELADVKSSRSAAIAEGRLRARLRRGGERLDQPFALVLETRDDAVSRLTVYMDSRPHRLWTDGPILAFDGQAQP